VYVSGFGIEKTEQGAGDASIEFGASNGDDLAGDTRLPAVDVRTEKC
jgi:hypothetical protein